MYRRQELAILEMVMHSFIGEKLHSQDLSLINEDASPEEAKKFAEEIKAGEYDENKARKILYNIKKRNSGLIEIINAMKEVARKESGGNMKNVTPTIMSMVGVLYPLLINGIERALNNDNIIVFIRDRSGKIVGQEIMANVRSVVDEYQRKDKEYPYDIKFEAIANMLINKDADATSFENVEGKVYNGLMFSLPKVARYFQRKKEFVEKETEGEGEKVSIFTKTDSGERIDFELKSSKEKKPIEYIAKVLKDNNLVGRLTAKQVEKYFLIPIEYGSCLNFANMISRKGIENIYIDNDQKFIDVIKDFYSIDPDAKDKGQIYNTNNRKIASALKEAIEKGLFDDFEEKFKMSLENISRILCTGENEKYRLKLDIASMEKEVKEKEKAESESEDEDTLEIDDEEFDTVTSKAEKKSIDKMSQFERALIITSALINAPEKYLEKTLDKYRPFLKDLNDSQKNKVLSKHPSLKKEFEQMISESTKQRLKLLSGIIKLSYE